MRRRRSGDVSRHHHRPLQDVLAKAEEEAMHIEEEDVSAHATERRRWINLRLSLKEKKTAAQSAGKEQPRVRVSLKRCCGVVVLVVSVVFVVFV